jgi:Uma2 family endonuclease
MTLSSAWSSEPEPRRWSRDEFYRMAECGVLAPDERLELVEGMLFRMPRISPPRAVAIMKSLNALQSAFGPGFFVARYFPVVVGEDTELYPELSVLEGEPEDYLNDGDVTPALVLDVRQAESTYNSKKKAELYAQAGIQDYWMLNVSRRELEVRRRAQQDTDPGFAPATTHETDAPVAPLAAPSGCIKLSDLLPKRKTP